MNKRGVTPSEIREYDGVDLKGNEVKKGGVYKNKKFLSGFTLVEILISIALLTVGVVLLINALVIGTEGLTVARRRIKAIDYAQKVMEERIVGFGFNHGNLTAVAGSKTTHSLTPIDNFTRSYEVWYVTATDLKSISTSATDYKRIKVTVRDNLGIVEDITLETLRTNY